MATPSTLEHAGLGLPDAFCLLVGLALGGLASSALQLLPLFMLFGLILGAVGAVLVTRSQLNRWG